MFKLSKFELIAGSISNSITVLLEELEKKNKLNDELHKKILLYQRKADEWKITSRRYTYIIFTMYFALYCSVTSVFFNSFFILDDVFSFLTQIVSITGTTIFIITLGLAQYIRDIHYQKLILLQSQINLVCSVNNIEPDFILTLEHTNSNDYDEILKLMKK